MPSKSASSVLRTSSAMTVTKAAQAAALVLDLDDVGRLAIALALAAADEVEENSRFARRVRTAYEMLPPSKPRPSQRGMPKALTATLTPIKRVEGGEINPVTPLDPYLLLEVYGARQLPQALDLYPTSKLREAATLIAEQHARPRPVAKASKAHLIAYIVEQLVSNP